MSGGNKKQGRPQKEMIIERTNYLK